MHASSSAFFAWPATRAACWHLLACCASMLLPGCGGHAAAPASGADLALDGGAGASAGSSGTAGASGANGEPSEPRGETRPLQPLPPPVERAPEPLPCAPESEWSFAAGACVQLELGQRPGDVCGPAGEGEVRFAPCDARRGLRCVMPPRELEDAPPTCACAPGQAWDAEARRCAGTRLGEVEGDPCGSAPDAELAFGACNERRGLFCDSSIAEQSPPTCRCGGAELWIEGEGRCRVSQNLSCG